MDDTSPKPAASQSNIDDLVKELSRPQSPPPTSTPPQAPQSSSSVLPPSMPSRPVMPPSAMPNPVPPKPSPVTPVPPVSPVAPTVPKEYQSSIRTMSDDLAKLKAGQIPQGVNIPRKIDNTPVVPPVKPTPVTPPLAASVKPLPQATLTPGVKSSPLAPSANPIPKPTLPPSAIPRPAQPPTSVLPPLQKTPDIKPDSKNQFYVPSANTPSGSGGSRSALFIGIAVGVVFLGAIYWYFMIYNAGIDQVAESPIETFTPRPTATPVIGLEAVFPDKGGTIVLPAVDGSANAFQAGFNAQPTPVAGKFSVLTVQGPSPASSSMPFTLGAWDILSRVIEDPTSFAAGIKPVGGKLDSAILIYGQQESFDSKGRPIANTSVSKRLVLVAENTSGATNANLSAWEPKMPSALASLFGLDKTKDKGLFSDTSYKGVSIRFKNFLYPDHSIDYANLQYNGKTYLLMASSREAMFAAIDAFVVSGK